MRGEVRGRTTVRFTATSLAAKKEGALLGASASRNMLPSEEELLSDECATTRLGHREAFRDGPRCGYRCGPGHRRERPLESCGDTNLWVSKTGSARALYRRARPRTPQSSASSGHSTLPQNGPWTVRRLG